MSDDLRSRIAAHRSWGDGYCECEFEFGEDALKWADHLIAELASWDILMELLDKHYPVDIFPTLPDDDRRDPGPRIVSLIRYLDQARECSCHREGGSHELCCGHDEGRNPDCPIHGDGSR